MTTNEDAPERGESTREYLGDVDRRDYLRTVGAAGTAGLLGGSASGRAAAQSGDWEAAADDRIAEHRQGTLEVRVEDENGQPVSNADVEVEMQEHDFHFGTAVNADLLVNGEDKDGNQVDQELVDKYRQITKEKFNTAVLENAHKWKFWEDDRQRADEATNWLLDEAEMDVRGHVCIWGRQDVGAIPDDVLTAVENRDAETIRQRTNEHIQEIIEYYGDDIMEWEVANEMINVSYLHRGVYGDQVNWRDDENIWEGEVVPWKSELLADWYQTAQEAAPEDVGLCVNDFNVLTAEYDYADTWYVNQIEHLQNNGIELDGVGAQSHMRVDDEQQGDDDSEEDRRLTPSEIMNDLDLFSEPGPGIRITEFDFAQSSTDVISEEEKADYFYKFLKTTFSHPNVEQFLMWGFWDRLHWSPPHSPMFDENFERKPGFDVWENLVFGQWWTEESGTTDSSGSYTVDAFLGEHEITVDGSVTRTVSVTDSDAVQQVTVTVSDDPGTGEGPPAVGDGSAPQDPDEDGLYEDVNGDGSTNLADAGDLFQHRNGDAVQNNVDAYDFSGNDEIDLADVVQLFQENTN